MSRLVRNPSKEHRFEASNRHNGALLLVSLTPLRHWRDEDGLAAVEAPSDGRGLRRRRSGDAKHDALQAPVAHRYRPRKRSRRFASTSLGRPVDHQERTQASLGHELAAALRRLREGALGARIWPLSAFFCSRLRRRARSAIWTSSRTSKT